MDAGEILLSRGLLDSRQLELTRAAQPDGNRLDQTAVQLGLVREDDALRAVGEELGLEFVDLSHIEVDLALLKNFPSKLIHRHSIFPVSRQNGTLLVATSDPFDLYAIDAVSAMTGLSTQPVLAASDEIAKLIKANFGVGSETVDGLLAQRQEQDVEVLDELELDGSEAAQMAQEASVVRLVNEILVEAIEARTSDIHIESQATGMKIRYRIDGVLQTQPTPRDQPLSGRDRQPTEDHGPHEHRQRLPQDGRTPQGGRTRGRHPRVDHSHVAWRGDRHARARQNRMKLTAPPAWTDIYAEFQQLITLPHGILLVTGPTGQKTTTLYSA